MAIDVIMRTHLTPDVLADLGKRFRIHSLALFGSVLRQDFTDESDVDVLVELEDTPTFTVVTGLADALELIIGRKVDLLTKQQVLWMKNPMCRQNILSTAKVLHGPS